MAYNGDVYDEMAADLHQAKVELREKTSELTFTIQEKERAYEDKCREMAAQLREQADMHSEVVYQEQVKARAAVAEERRRSQERLRNLQRSHDEALLAKDQQVEAQRERHEEAMQRSQCEWEERLEGKEAEWERERERLVLRVQEKEMLLGNQMQEYKQLVLDKHRELQRKDDVRFRAKHS